MRTGKLRRCYWLDLGGLASYFAGDEQRVVRVCYFSAVVRGNPDKSKRHSTYIDAIKATGGVEVILGNYQLEPLYCGNCHRHRNVPKEKQTDTSIATEMLTDAFQDKWDHAYLVSADSDLVPPIKKIREVYPEKKITVMFPPCRSSDDLRQAANAYFCISQRALLANQLPDAISCGEFVLNRPAYWK